VAWRRSGAETTLDVTLPEGVSGHVRMPGVTTAYVETGTHHFTW
jgi:hypothetical protein